MNTFGAAHRWGVGGGQAKRPTMTKLGTVIPYLKEIQKIYESRDTLSVFSWHQHFFHQKPANFALSGNTDIDCILVDNLIISSSFSFSWVFKDLFNKPGYNVDDVSKNGYSRSS